MPLRGKRLLVIDAGDELASAVAAAAGRAGASLAVCRGGRAALEALTSDGADAAIVDLPLPDVRGDAFLVALRDRGVPCVAVSAVLRGERYAEIARGFGAAGFFERPFSAEDAIAALGKAIGAAPPTTAPSPQPSPPPRGGEGDQGDQSGPLVSLPLGGGGPGRGSAETNAPLASVTGSAVTIEAVVEPDFDSLIFSSARPALDDTLPGIPLTPPARAGLALPLPAAVLPPARPVGAPTMPHGQLSTSRLPRVLAALCAARFTGALTVVNGTAKKLVGLAGGRPVFAVSNLASERFAACAVKAGVLSAEALRALVAEIGPERRVAEALLSRGLLAPAHRAELVARQIHEILWSAFAWSEGTYRVLEGPFERPDLVPVDVAPGVLILEGVRRTAALDELRAALPPALALSRGAAPAVPLEELSLAPEEERFLSNADGTKTVSDLVALGGLPEQDALALLHACREMGLLVEVSRVLAGTRRIGFM